VEGYTTAMSEVATDNGIKGSSWPKKEGSN